MVLEFIEGRTLRDFLRETAQDPLRTRNDSRREAIAVELIVPVVRALVCAHEAHIVHRDLKPENILLANSGEVRVVDFGIAKQVSLDRHHPARGSRPDSTQHDLRMTHTGAMVGTLAYMAPEQWLLEESIDARIDIWALGIILFELVVGEHPLAPLTPLGLANLADLDKPMPRVRDKQPGAGPIAEIIDRCLAKRKEERYASTKELLAALEAVGDDQRTSLMPGNEEDAPFTGLSAFQEADAARFFGRESDIAALMGRLRHQELITITGASGAGKSSFVRAGIIPAFKRSTASAETLVIRPGLRPLAALADALGSLTQTDPSRPSIHDVDEIAALLRSRPGAFGAQLRTRCRERGETHRILLFVDQLEELYTLGISPEDRAAFHACLCGAADDASSPLRVVLAVRADFLDRMSEDRSFMSLVTRGLVFLPPIGHDSLRDALEKPVATTKYRFENDALVCEMLDALAGSKSPLPLLQFTATKLWEARDRDNRLLTWASYRALGGVAGALSTHADAVLAGMSSREQQLARLIFVRLVTPERTRAIVPWDELCAIAADREAVALVIERLSNARILAIETSGDAAERLVELLHESLLERWAKLGQWLDENAQDAQFLTELRQAAQQWEKNDKAEGFLWRDRAAIKLSVWFDGHKTSDHIGLGTREIEYSNAVIAYAQKTRRRRRNAVIGFLLAMTAIAVVFSVLALLARSKAYEADRAEKRAEERAREATEQREKADENAVAANDARLVAVVRELRNRGQFTTGLQLLRLVKRPESARGWITLTNEALALNALEVTLRGGDKPFSMAAWSPDGKRIAAASLDGKVWIWKADGTGAPNSFEVREKPIHSIDFYPDGEHILLVSGDGQAYRVGLDGKELTPLGTSLESARFVPNKPWMVMTMKDGSVRIESLSDKDPSIPIVLKVGTTKLHDAVPSADGSAIVTRADDNRVRVWQRSGHTWRAVVHRDQGSKVLHAALSPDGRRVVTASGNDTVQVGPADGKGEATLLRVDGDTIGQASFSADGRYVLGRSHERNLLYVWPAAGGAPLVVAGAHDGPISWAAWGPDGTRALSVSGTVVKVWRFSTLEALPRSRRPRLYLAAIEADGEHAVAAFDDNKVRRFGLGAADVADEVSRENSWIIGLATSPRGNRSLIAVLDGRVRIEEGSGADKKTLNLSGSAGSVWGGAFAPDGERVVTCADDKSVRIWSRENDEWQKLIDLLGHTDLATGAAWSPDSKRLVTSSEDGTARVWDVLSGNQIVSFKHDGPVFAVAWSPDGQQIATSSLKNGLRVWDASGQGEPIEFVVVSPLIALGFMGGGRIVGVSEDGATHQVLVDVRKLSLALEQSNRDCLSPAQRQTYLIESKEDAEQGYADCEGRQLRTPTLMNPQSVSDQVKAPLSGRRWSLVVSPVEATVEVQGVRVPRRGGLIDLVGKQGDELRIRVSLGSTVIEKNVVLQKATLSPSKIDFFEAIAVREKPHEPPARFKTDN